MVDDSSATVDGEAPPVVVVATDEPGERPFLTPNPTRITTTISGGTSTRVQQEVERSTREVETEALTTAAPGVETTVEVGSRHGHVIMATLACMGRLHSNDLPLYRLDLSSTLERSQIRCDRL